VETLFAGVHGLALSAVDQLRALWPDAPNGNATLATRTTVFALQTDKKTALAVRLLRSFYCFFKNALVTVLRYACEVEARTRGERVKPYIELLTEATCDPFFWTFLKAADPRRHAQLVPPHAVGPAFQPWQPDRSIAAGAGPDRREGRQETRAPGVLH
jgi:hypothetical protein